MSQCLTSLNHNNSFHKIFETILQEKHLLWLLRTNTKDAPRHLSNIIVFEETYK